MKKATILILVLFIVSCGKKSPEETHVHGAGSISITQWSDHFEFFMEFSEDEMDDKAEFSIHLTHLVDFKPVIGGSVQLQISPDDKEVVREISAIAVRDGIYNAQTSLAEIEDNSLSILVKTSTFSDTFEIGNIHPHEKKIETTHADAEEEHDENHTEASGNMVTFLKEQQWNTEFETTAARRGKTRSYIDAVAEVIPQQQRYAEIASPVDAFLNPKLNREIVIPGSHLKAGNVLLTLSPSVASANSWTERQLSYLRAEKDFLRVQQLKEHNAISEREYDLYQQNYNIEKAAFESIKSAYNVESISNKKNTPLHLVLRSPINGFVANVNVSPGQLISAGQKLLTIIDPSVVWIQAEVYERDIHNLALTSEVELILPQQSNVIDNNKSNIKLLSVGEIIEPHSRTIPLIFEVDNKNRALKIGQVLQTQIFTEEGDSSIIVSASSVIDEISRQFVFVQHEGESFEKRNVETGNSFQGQIAITEGLERGERVVSKGAYLLKLASMQTGQIGHGHVH